MIKSLNEFENKDELYIYLNSLNERELIEYECYLDRTETLLKRHFTKLANDVCAACDDLEKTSLSGSGLEKELIKDQIILLSSKATNYYYKFKEILNDTNLVYLDEFVDGGYKAFDVYKHALSIVEFEDDDTWSIYTVCLTECARVLRCLRLIANNAFSLDADLLGSFELINKEESNPVPDLIIGKRNTDGTWNYKSVARRLSMTLYIGLDISFDGIYSAE